MNLKAFLTLDTKSAEKSLSAFGRTFGALVAAVGVKEIVQLGDEFTSLRNRLNSVSETSAQAANAFNLVKGVASATRSGLGDVADLFANITIATKEMGLSQEQVARTAETFSKALKVSGADANASAGAIRQFGQALASGVLRGDEFNSIMEANPTFMRKVAEVIGVSTGELRKLAEQGLLTSDVMVAATEEIGDSIDQDFAKTVSTVSEAFVNLQNAFMELLGNIEANTGVFSGLAELINHIADNLDVYIKLAAIAFGVATVRAIINVVKAIQALSVVTKIQAAAQAALLALSGPAGWLILAGAGAAATAAIKTLNWALGDATETTDDLTTEMEGVADTANDNQQALRRVTNELERQFDVNEDGILQAGEIVRLNVKLQENQKKAKQAEEERLRILERQRQTFNAITGELAIQNREYTNRLNLGLQTLVAHEEEKKLIQETADLEKDRAEAIADLNALTLLGAEQRAQKEAEINRDFDDRVSKLRQAVDLENNINRTLQQREAMRGAVNQYALMAGDVLALGQRLDVMDADERRRMEERQRLAQEIAVSEIALQDKYNDLRIAKEIQLGRTLNNAEIEFLREKYNLELSNLNDINDARQTGLELYLQGLDSLNARIRTFGQGWRDAMMEFQTMVEDEAAYGKKIFDTMANGWSDAIVRFAETGKLSFKDLFKSLMVEIIRMQANKIFLSLFGAGGFFDMSNLFGAPGKAVGGPVRAGGTYLVGERGPELLRMGNQSGTIIPNHQLGNSTGSSATYVTYNIQAVDAPSFQQLVARDPEFIYNVSRVGARRVPGG